MKKENECLSKSAAYKSRTGPPQYFAMVSLKGEEPEDTIKRDGIIYDKADHIPIDLDAISDYARKELARAIIESCKKALQEPGAEEEFQTWLAERKKRKI